MGGYEFIEVDGGAPLKMWTRNVQIEDAAIAKPIIGIRVDAQQTRRIARTRRSERNPLFRQFKIEIVYAHVDAL